ncbi:AI-2E family transporter [Auritidibacter ignavus]|uniref:AI-2E family transporter n=1 Tax=Auritidibacter ignavus TaxID=678932 RepID=A0AAJ6AQQ2_9MICC|nr:MULTISPECIES: AI-2E family transporter [Auritidibacter]PXA78962.1 AI-2E family transporter [Auritidibacter sp. NML120636]WGH82466.1 AI-2E family transporter [Auritidibacter ignavus]WGH91657.1 AI-2E family transporter [Auritidibacter ignavus]WGH94104.1 AI-2E family transporter [Auritidibacter ignavus]
MTHTSNSSEHASETAQPAAETSTRIPRFSLKQLWTDVFGRTSIRAAQILLIGIVAIAVIFAMLQLTLIVIPTLLALIIACALWPLVRLCRTVMNSMLAAWSVFLGSLLVLGGVGTALVFSVMSEWETLVNQAINGFNQLRAWADELLGDVDLELRQEQVDSLLNSIQSFLTSPQFGTGAVNTISAAGSFVTGLVLFLVILFFFLKDGDRIWAFFVSWTPEHFRDKWIASGDRAQRTFGGYIRGTAIVAAVDAVGITIALLILQVPLAIPLGVVVFLGSFIPMVGATLAGILATLIALVANGPVVAIIVLAAVILVNQLEGNFLQPVVMSQTLKLHALIILMALTGGTVLAGIIGAILAVPLVAVIWAVIKVWTGRDGENDKVDQAQHQIRRVAEENKERERQAKKERKKEHDKRKAAKDAETVNKEDSLI